LLWATYYGGNNYGQGLAITLDASDNVYITGNTGSTTGIATAGALKTTYNGPSPNAFVAKFNPTGTSLLWGTYFGKSETTGFGIKLDATGNVCIAGSTSSATDIATPGAYKSVISGGLNAYVAKIDPTGSTEIWGTYYGTQTTCIALALDAADNAFITGETQGTTGISTPGAYKTTTTSTTGTSVFVAKISSNGSTLDYGTYYGGSTTASDEAYSIVVDAADNAYITGQCQSATGIATAGAYKTTLTAATSRFNAFVAKFNSTGSTLDWGTYYGGTGDDEGYGIALDANDNSYVTGWTASTSGISTPNAYQTVLHSGPGGGNCFVAKFDPTGSTLDWGTYYGGTSWDIAWAITLNPCNDVYITGEAESSNDIATPGAYQTTRLGGGFSDNAFVSEFDSTGGSTALVVTAKNTHVLCNGGSTGTAIEITTSGNGPFTYLWSPGGQTGDTATGLSAGTYKVTVTDPCGNVDTASTTITQPAVLTALASTPSACSGTASVTAGGGTLPYSYSWTPGGQTSATITGLSSGTYTVTVTDSSGTCSQTASVIIGASNLAIALSSPGSCSGVLTANASGGTTPYTYLWAPGGQTTATVTGLSTGSYSITVTDANGCHITADTSVAGAGTPLTITAKGDTTVCAGVMVTLIASAPGASGVLTWKPGTLTGDTIKVDPAVSTTYTVTGTNECGASSAKDSIIVYSTPVVKFTPTPDSTTILAPVIQFTNNTTDAYGIASWNWRFGDSTDSSSQSQNTIHTYQDTGTFCPWLVATNTKGCIDSAKECVVIYPAFSFYIPSAFTPNGNHVNDIFLPKGSYVTSFDMYIFNRWGNVLFHTTSLDNGWNGTANNMACPQDTYVYSITVYDSRKVLHNYTGDVTLLR